MTNIINSQINEAKQFLMVSSYTKVQKILNSLENDQLTGEQLLKLQLLKLQLFNERGNHRKCIKLSSELISEYDNHNIQLIYIDIIIELVKALLSKNQHEECLKEIQFAEDILTKFEKKSSREFKEKIASVFLIKGTVYIELGKFKKALKYTNQGITLYKEIQDKLGEIQSYSQLGNIHLLFGELELAIEYLEESLHLLEQNQNPLEKSKTLSLLGRANNELGNFKQGLNFARRSLKLAKRVENDKQLFNSVNLIANVYVLSGESTKALKYRQEALNLAIKSGNVEDLEKTYHNLSFSYRYKGDLAQAFLLLEKSLKLSKELKNNSYIANALYELIAVAMDLDKSEQAQKYLKELENIQMSEDNPIIKQEFQLASAYTLKKSQRPKDKFDALNIFEKITNTPPLHFELYLFALLNYSELLFYEYQISNHTTILDNIERVLNLLYTTAKKNNSILILVQTYWLQSKYALIQLDISKAKELLFQAQFLAEEKELKQLSEILEKENRLMNEQIVKRGEYLKNNVPLPERLELTQIQHLIGAMIQKRTNFQTDNLLLKQTELLHEELERRRENFIWITNHEIRTPLTVVSGFIDFLQNNIDDIDQDKRNRILKLIKRNLDRLERLSDQISLLFHLDRVSNLNFWELREHF